MTRAAIALGIIGPFVVSLVAGSVHVEMDIAAVEMACAAWALGLALGRRLVALFT